MAPYIRIALRYLAGYLVFKNLIPAEWADMIANDPDIVAGVGIALALCVEGFYAMARRFGWAK